MSKLTELQKIHTQLSKYAKDLADEYYQVFQDNIANNRAVIPNSGLKRIATEESVIILDLLQDPDKEDFAWKRGIKLCEQGLGEESLIALDQKTWTFCVKHLPEDLKAQALETFNLYHKTVLQSYIQAREDNVMGQVEALLQETIALQQLSQALSGAFSFDDILDIFYQTCTKVLGFDFVVFSLVDPKQQRVKAIGGIGVSRDHLERANHPLDSEDIMADIIRTGKTEVITGWDSRFDKKIFEDEGMDEWGLRIFTPINLRRENIGLVEVGFNHHIETSVDESQIRLLRTFIDQTALALENAKREEASQQAVQREALIKNITTKVRASTNLDTVLQTTVKEIGDALGGKRVYIHLISSNNGQ